MREFWACLELLHSVLHVEGGVLAEVHEADVAQLVPVMVHSSGVHRAQLQLLPLEVHLHRGAAASQPYHARLLQADTELRPGWLHLGETASSSLCIGTAWCTSLHPCTIACWL
jgi:hypothetical protein